MSTIGWIGAGSAATPAATTAAIPPGAVGRLQGPFQRGGRCGCRGDTLPVVQCDPIEKKPFFHAWPGALAYSFGMLGCDLHCAYCQNWVTSQALRDPAATAPRVTSIPRTWRATPCGRAPGSSSRPTTNRSSRSNGAWRCSRRRARKAWPPASSRTAMGRRRCSTTSRRGSMSTRSI